jgi:Zn-dependent peptidase ImmA (M78 family)
MPGNRKPDEREQNDDDLERLAYDAMQSLGWLIPQTPEDVARAEQALAEEPVELPESLQNPYAVLDAPPKERAMPRTSLPASPGKAGRSRRRSRSGCAWIGSERREDTMVTDSRKPIFLSQERRQEICELAEIVADEHCPGIRIEPLAIAKAKGMTVSFGRYEDAFDGLLEHQGERFHIYCNLDRVTRADAPRARFTLGHELGHFYIDEHRNALRLGRAPAHPSFCEYESKNPVEQEADLFASCLLMPSARFLQQAKRLPVGLGGILALARTFGTSVTSTAIRYATLRVKPCVVVKWSPDGYAWKWLSYDAREAGYRKTIESVADIADGSATAQARSGASLPSAGFFQTGTTASAWFPSIPGGAFRNVILIEQAVALGRFGVLTFLYPESGTFPWVSDER